MTILPARLSASNAYRASIEAVCFDQSFDTALDTSQWADLSSGGSLSLSAATSALELTVSTGSGATAKVRSHARPKASVGRSRSVVIVGHVSAAVTSQRKRWGLFDDANGHFFELSGETLYAVRRSNVSGSVVDTQVANAVWNTANSAADATKTHVWEIRETWPSGDISFFVDGQLRHVISTKGQIIGPSGRTARLPVTAECTNLAVTSAGSFKLVAATVVVEQLPTASRLYSVERNDASVTISDKAILAIKPRATFNGYANLGEIIADTLTATCSADTLFKLILGASITNGSFNAPSAESIAEVNTTMTAWSGGVELAYVTEGGLALSELRETIGTLRLRGDGSTVDTLLITAAAASGTVSARCALTWKEVR